jgi:hypothetical protein
LFLNINSANLAVWRRVHAHSNTSIAAMHDLLQIVFDRSDYLRRFMIMARSMV